MTDAKRHIYQFQFFLIRFPKQWLFLLHCFLLRRAASKLWEEIQKAKNDVTEDPCLETYYF
jgi:hypothetical protein